MRRNNVGGFMSPADGRAGGRWRSLRQRIWSGRNGARTDLTPGGFAAAPSAQSDVGNSAAAPRRQRVRRSVALVLSSLTALSGMVAGAAPASAQEPVYEITGDWVDAPATIARGNPVVAEWRVNINDGENPPGNDPVDNVTVDFTLDKAIFDELPDVCLTEGVTPPSSISEDGTTLTCNFGRVNMGTAVVVQTPVVATGITGEEVTGDGTIDGQTEELPPIPIQNNFAMDIHFGQNSTVYVWDDVSDPTYVDFDIEWSLRIAKGSDPGPKDVTYRLTLTAENGAPVGVGVHPPIGAFPDNRGDAGCTPFDAGRADGHPWSEPIPNQPPEKITSFVDECILTDLGGGEFELTLRGINYDLLNLPTHDSSVVNDNAGNPLPPNWDYIATGSLWFRANTSENGSTALVSDTPTYTSDTPVEQTFVDPAGNNTTNKAYTLPGGWSAAWYRNSTGSGGNAWDDTYRVAAGTTVLQGANNSGGNVDDAPTAIYGNCLAFDTAFVQYVDYASQPDPVYPEIRGYSTREGDEPSRSFELVNPPAIEYYTGGVGDPNDFDCATAGWTTTKPADVSTVTAIRIRYPHSLYEDEGATGISLFGFTRINDNVQVGQDVWMFGSALRGTLNDGEWLGTQQVYDDRRVPTPTPDYRYPSTNGRRDVLVIITALPYIEKEAAKSTVTPGVPADFTLRYSANGQGLVPPTVDDYEIVDTLPVGMTYKPGSASPEPVVTTSGGQQVLTWTLDDVATNEEHELTYQATADASVEPGTPLTNVAESTYGPETTDPVEETVTTTTNGYTTILKTSDVEYIPNEDGDGTGEGSWTVTIESFDPRPQAFTDTIDILPYNGDGRGTSFSGSYTLEDVVVPDGVAVYYTDDDPSTLSDDPADPDGSNGAAGDPTGNTVGWTTDKPDTVTAFRVIGGELAPGETLSFQLLIATDGASPGDVYVNRAQARAEHTELVMRTSAELVVTDYLVEKTSDPTSGSTVEPGDTVEYTVTVTQQGNVPAGAWLKDDLSDVFDDATYNDDVEADIGEATVEGDTLLWEAEVPVGEKATITYSVTVDDTDEPEEIHLLNVVSSPGCVEPDNCTTEHLGPQPDLPETGSDPAALVALAGALGLGGLVLMTASRRRVRPAQQNEPLTNDPF